MRDIRRYTALSEYLMRLCSDILLQRRFKAAFEAYKERELPNVRAEVCQTTLLFLCICETHW